MPVDNKATGKRKADQLDTPRRAPSTRQTTVGSKEDDEIATGEDTEHDLIPVKRNKREPKPKKQAQAPADGPTEDDPDESTSGKYPQNAQR